MEKRIELEKRGRKPEEVNTTPAYVFRVRAEGTMAPTVTRLFGFLPGLGTAGPRAPALESRKFAIARRDARRFIDNIVYVLLL